MEDRQEKTTDKKRYLILLLLPTILLGIWKCLNHSKESSGIEIETKKDSSQLVKSMQEESVF